MSEKKDNFMCKYFGHKYQHVVRIQHNVNTVTGYMHCKRCDEMSGSTTVGPIYFHCEPNDVQS